MAYRLGTVTHAAFFSRVEVGARNIENFDMDRLTMIEVIKMTILRDYGIAQTSLREYYITPTILTTVMSSVDNTQPCVKIEALNLMDVLSVSKGTAIPYMPAKSHSELVKIASPTSHEHKSSRYYLPMKGIGEVWLFNGANITPADTSVTLVGVRYPMVAEITENSVITTTDFMDIPDWLVGFSVLSCIVQAVKEKGLTPPQALLQQTEGAIAQLSDRLAADEARALQMAQNSVSR